MSLHTELVPLLSSGGDGRLDVGEDGLNRYGCRFEPEPGTIQLGSCTASTVSELGFGAAQEAHERLRAQPELVEAVYDDLRDRLIASVVPASSPRPEAFLMPSGTDAEYIPLLLALAEGQRVTNVVIAPTEVGSGSLIAAELRHFDALTPNGEQAVSGQPTDADLARMVTAVPVRVRDDLGDPLDPATIDERTESVVDEAMSAGEFVLLHVVAHSKTGVHAPSLEYVRRAQERYGDRLHVVVDAAQGRISRRGLGEALEAGWTVIITGSKFFGGPPFSGAVLVPERYRSTGRRLTCPPGLRPYFSSRQAPEGWSAWRASTPSRPDLGVLLRWVAAMAEIESYYALDDSARFRILRSFERSASAALGSVDAIHLEDASPSILDNAAARLLQSKHTVFSFALRNQAGERLDANGLRRVQRALRTGTDRPDDASGERPKRVQTGQPVIIAPDGTALLRIALGAPLLRRYSMLDPRAVDQVIDSDLHFVARWLESAA